MGWRSGRKRISANDPWQAKKDLKAIEMKAMDLEDFWGRNNQGYARCKASGGNMDYVDIIDMIMENIHGEFYLEIIRKSG